MKQLTATVLATAILFPAIVAAQIKTLPGETLTVTATVEAIERSSRSLTLKGPEGRFLRITVPADVKRFDALNVGDTITARYYENIVLRVKAPGEKAVDTLNETTTPTPGSRPGATAAAQRTITATITAIDPSVPSITLSGPNNWKHSSRIADTAVLKQVKVGDRLDITWTEAVLLSADPPKPK
jgi:hypothetical protein